ncbi:hypothetical protein B0T42_12360 [Rathayibacter sp. VKM Ac-2630]|nr:hypothetical protein B0T42_12360 [Rathayibacter sp. VKM Ac-2630]
MRFFSHGRGMGLGRGADFLPARCQLPCAIESATIASSCAEMSQRMPCTDSDVDDSGRCSQRRMSSRSSYQLSRSVATSCR